MAYQPLKNLEGFQRRGSERPRLSSQIKPTSSKTPLARGRTHRMAAPGPPGAAAGSAGASPGCWAAAEAIPTSNARVKRARSRDNPAVISRAPERRLFLRYKAPANSSPVEATDASKIKQPSRTSAGCTGPCSVVVERPATTGLIDEPEDGADE